ncbi:hypothetical protein [Pleomorphomonas sp. JP5]|uniref:hypothetical protein n=1 Tax=Pleomorphomonas sp. JP5 TaxID=2942998 RepID=UPI002044BEDF|nr:hypothetical protein [Pleomorphomonas sp. JP5]MCM5559047.1 hypothetical protein [Pleomorphomonas sp. JP5]
MMSVGFSGKILSALALAVTLSACSSDNGFSPRSLVSGGPDPKAEQEALERFAVVAVCPEVQVRDGTQMLAVFEKGKEGDYSAIRFQGTIRKFARECHTDASGTTTIKVGVAGRLLAGPKGLTGSTSLPVRVVMVRNGDEVLYSKLYPVNATIAPGTAAADWDLVAPDLVVTGDKTQGNFIIYVGFDESKKK